MDRMMLLWLAHLKWKLFRATNHLVLRSLLTAQQKNAPLNLKACAELFMMSRNFPLSTRWEFTDVRWRKGAGLFPALLVNFRVITHSSLRQCGYGVLNMTEDTPLNTPLNKRTHVYTVCKTHTHTLHMRTYAHTSRLCAVLTLQVEGRLTVGLDPSAHCAVSELVFNCLLLSYSLSYEEQEVRKSCPRTQIHAHTYPKSSL